MLTHTDWLEQVHAAGGAAAAVALGPEQPISYATHPELVGLSVPAALGSGAPVLVTPLEGGLLLLFLPPGITVPADAGQKQLMAVTSLVMQQRRLLEQLKEAGAEMAMANRAKSEFLSNMSHELRTPLNAIIGFSEIMLDPEMAVDEETQKQFLENILVSGRHLLHLLGDILDLAKIEAGKMELAPGEFLVADALQGVHTLIKPLAAKKRQALELTLDPAVSTIWHDHTRFKQVVYNLVHNAVKFTPERGRVELRASLTPGDDLEVAVCDNGIGIKPELQDLIFQDFRQIDAGYDRIEQGAGLGLSLVRRFVRLMGGDVRLQSELGQGSTFTVRLPLRQPIPEPGGARP